MTENEMQSSNIYELRLNTLLPSSATIFIAAILLNSQNLLLFLPGPAIMLAIFIALLISICLTARFLTSRLIAAMNFDYPTVTLWCYPTMAMFLITGGAYAFLTTSNHFFGRGFWSDHLGLTSQDTTSFFFSCFAAMLFFIALQFTASIFKVFNWIIAVSREHLQLASQINAGNSAQQQIGDIFEQIRNHNEEIKEKRLKATRLNRIALVTFVGVAGAFASWVTYYRPELILYYRAEIQLRSYIEPLAAYETFRHLSEKYPGYRFIDSVQFRMAWILDRRINDHEKARQSYEKFIERFGYANVWSDEALISLVRLSLDKLNDPQMAMRWSESYLNHHPRGIMAPHMYLYRIRALRLLGDPQKALQEKEKARLLFTGQKIQLVNSEDRLIGLANFSEVLQAESHDMQMQ